MNIYANFPDRFGVEKKHRSGHPPPDILHLHRYDADVAYSMDSVCMHCRFVQAATAGRVPRVYRGIKIGRDEGASPLHDWHIALRERGGSVHHEAPQLVVSSKSGMGH